MKNFTLRHITLAIVISAVLLAVRQMRAEQPTAESKDVPVIQLTEVPLPNAIELLARQADINFILDPRVAEFSGINGERKLQTVSARWENITAKEGLNRLAKEHNLVLVENPVTTVARIAPANSGVKPVERAQLGNDTNSVVPVVSMMDAPFEIAVQTFADQLHVKIAIDEKLSQGEDGKRVELPTVSFRWENLTAKQALVALLDNYDFALIENAGGATARITRREKSPAKTSGESRSEKETKTK